MKRIPLLASICANCLFFFGPGLPKASAVNFGFDGIPWTSADVLAVDADEDSIDDLVFTPINVENPQNLGIGFLEFPATSLLRTPYLYGIPGAGADLEIKFLHGVRNSFAFDLSLFAPTSITTPVPAGQFSLFDVMGVPIGQSTPFNAAPAGAFAQTADVSIVIQLDPATIPYSMVLDFETTVPPQPPPDLTLSPATLVIDPIFWGFGIDNLAGTFGSTETPGSSPANPLLPNLPDSNGGFNFSVTFPDPNTIVFIDPFVAVGYTYAIVGDLFDAVQPPSNLTDQTFDLLVGDATCTTFTPEATLTGGLTHTFTAAVPCFQIRGIDLLEALDPANPAAFITGISTVNPGTYTISQTPITEFVPGPLPLAGAGAAFAFSRRLRSRIQSSRLQTTPAASGAAGAG